MNRYQVDDLAPRKPRRGGEFLAGTGAGVFALHTGWAPSNWGSTVGLRCVHE
jgi:hypothetical protein